jgi:hypothetical protein
MTKSQGLTISTPNTNSVYLDSRHFFEKDFELLYQNLNTKDNIMHTNTTKAHTFITFSTLKKKMSSPLSMDEEETCTNKSPKSVESPFIIKTPEHCQYYLPPLQEGRASHEYKRKIILMYPSTVHTNITSMVVRCTTTDLDLQDALGSPIKETWLLNHHKLRCLPACGQQAT